MVIGFKSAVEFCGRHPFATGLFALLSAIGLILAIVDFGYSRQEAESTEAQLGRVEQQVFSLEETVRSSIQKPSAPAVSADIRGDWDASAAWSLVNSKLKNKTPPFCRGSLIPCKQIDHQALGEYTLLFRESQSIVLLSATKSPQHNCHPCGASISVFEFSKKDDGWYLEVEDIFALEIGSWGGLEAVDVAVRAIGSEVYGLFFVLGYTQMGESSDVTFVYCKLGDEYRVIFDWITSGSAVGMDGSGYDWETEINILDGVTGIFDMQVTVNDNEAGRRPAEDLLFRFDGQGYRIQTDTNYLLRSGGRAADKP